MGAPRDVQPRSGTARVGGTRCRPGRSADRGPLVVMLARPIKIWWRPGSGFPGPPRVRAVARRRTVACVKAGFLSTARTAPGRPAWSESPSASTTWRSRWADVVLTSRHPGSRRTAPAEVAYAEKVGTPVQPLPPAMRPPLTGALAELAAYLADPAPPIIGRPCAFSIVILDLWLNSRPQLQDHRPAEWLSRTGVRSGSRARRAGVRVGRLHAQHAGEPRRQVPSSTVRTATPPRRARASGRTPRPSHPASTRGSMPLQLLVPSLVSLFGRWNWYLRHGSPACCAWSRPTRTPSATSPLEPGSGPGRLSHSARAMILELWSLFSHKSKIRMGNAHRTAD